MERERMDLSPLDPRRDELAYERRIRRVLIAAETELARRAAANPFALMASWTRPTLVAASMVGLLAAGALALGDRSATSEHAPAALEPVSIAEVSAPEWLASDEEPTELLVMAMEETR